MAGTVVKIGPGVEDFSVGDQVFAMADNTYAELCVVKAAILGESSQRARFDSGGGVAAGDDDWQPAPLSYGNQGGPDGSRRRRCWKCRAFGGIHCEGARGDCDRGGFEEADRRARRLSARIRSSQPTTTLRLRIFRRSMRWRIRLAEEPPRS